MTSKPTQQQRVLEVLQSLRTDHDIPEQYVRRHPSGDGVSARYFKQVMLISEVNGRISELRNKGHEVETSTERDRYGFSYHRLKPADRELTRSHMLQYAKEAVAAFNAA